MAYIEPDFAKLHEATRHSIHLSETLAVAIETTHAMQVAERVFPVRAALRDVPADDAFHIAQRRLDLQARTLRGLKLRSESNHERLRNDITLVILPLTC